MGALRKEKQVMEMGKAGSQDRSCPSAGVPSRKSYCFLGEEEIKKLMCIEDLLCSRHSV